MATPTQHSKLSASAGSKWVYYPPTLWMEEGLPDFTSEYAQEGTDAHRLAELKISLATKAITKRKYNVEVKQLAERSKFYDKDMETYTDQHRDLVLEEYNSMQHAEIFTEQKVDATNIGFRAVKPDKTIIDVKGAGVRKMLMVIGFSRFLQNLHNLRVLLKKRIFMCKIKTIFIHHQT